MYSWLVEGQFVAAGFAYRLFALSVCDMNSAAAAAVCGLWRYTSVTCLCVCDVVVRTAGKPDPLVFHIPLSFFDCLQQRMSVGVGGRKKRLPNTSQSFVRRDAVPLGSFVKYTWRLTNVLHIKQIFDTPQVHRPIS